MPHKNGIAIRPSLRMPELPQPSTHLHYTASLLYFLNPNSLEEIEWEHVWGQKGCVGERGRVSPGDSIS